MSEKGKRALVPTLSKKRSYVSWNNQMDKILISVLYNQVKQENTEEDGDWKPQAYQVVADELKNKLGMSLTADHVRNHVKTWKKHYAVITEIRTKTNFKWDDERKMIDITMQDMAEWKKYTQANPVAASYSNKFIEHWDDISALVGQDRAIGVGIEHHDDDFTRMDEEACDGGGSSTLDTSSTTPRKRHKHDQLAKAITNMADTFRYYVETKLKSAPTFSGKEVYAEVSKVHGILPSQVLKTVKILLDSPRDFEMLKYLPEEQKLEWINLCLYDSR